MNEPNGVCVCVFLSQNLISLCYFGSGNLSCFDDSDSLKNSWPNVLLMVAQLIFL